MRRFSDYFQRLSGLWTLKREISGGSSFIGQVVFEKHSVKELSLSESGTLTLPTGTSWEAKRQWIWRFSGDDTLEIFYAETPPRMYHSMELQLDKRGWNGSASHLCAPDTYAGKYRFFENKFEIDQVVTGPKKDYSIKSIYSANTVGVPDHSPLFP